MTYHYEPKIYQNRFAHHYLLSLKLFNKKLIIYCLKLTETSNNYNSRRKKRKKNE